MVENESLKADEVAEILRIGRNTVYALARTGELSSYRIGRKLRFRYSDVMAFARGQRGNNANENRAITAIESANLSQTSDIEKSFKLVGDDIAGDVIASMLSRSNTSVVSYRLSGYDALVGLYRGDIDLACIHLYDMRTNSYNTPYVQRLAPGVPVKIFRLLRRRQGFVVAKGNPLRISTWGGILREGVRVANQQKGTGARVLLDEKLLSMEANHSLILGYDNEHSSDVAAIEAVVAGEADVAIASQQLAADFKDVDFIPMQFEWVDIVAKKREETRPLIRQMASIMNSSVFKGMISGAGEVDIEQMGAIIYEC